MILLFTVISMGEQPLSLPLSPLFHFTSLPFSSPPPFSASTSTHVLNHMHINTHVHAHTADDPEVDSRDVARIRDSLPYVCKFVRHDRGNFTNAYNHMVCSASNTIVAIIVCSANNTIVTTWYAQLATPSLPHGMLS